MKAQLARAQALLSRKKPNPDEAMKLLQPLVGKKNTPWPVYHFSGVAFMQKKEYQTALTFLEESVSQGADSPETYHSMSVCRYHLGDVDRAEVDVRKALEMKPDFFKAWLHLGSMYRSQAKLEEALNCYQKANQIDPKSAGVAFRIGEIYNDQGDLDKAVELYNITVKIDSSYLEAYLAKALALRQRAQYDQAEEEIYKALQEEPRHLGARVALAELNKLRGNYDKALELYDRLIEEFPNVAGVRSNYALCLQDLGRFDESEKNYLKAIKDQPGLFESLSNYLMGIHYNPERTKEEIFEAHKLWDQNFAPKERPIRPVPFERDAGKKLRVGMISGGFRTHPVGWMITRALQNLSKDQVEVYCYTTNNKSDRVTRLIHEASDKWQSVIGYKDEVIARMIREDEIDILIELSGHAADTRLKTVALEPAPVIVKWVGGLFNTTGMQSVDYLLTDHYETPAGEEKFYTEKLVRMPNDYICFMPPDYSPDVGPLPAKENGYITFGCFNNPTKVNDEILKKWAEIMNRVPESRLFLKSKQYDTEALCDRIVETMESCGISEDRILFEGKSRHDKLLECYNRIDIALDPWPYSGGLTTCEALWMGVPVVTKPGATFAGRHSATHLENAGFPEWVTGSWEEYADTVVGLASDTEALAERRESMRQQVAESPLCDGKRFGAHFAVALREMWKQRVNGYEKGLSEGEWQDHIDVKPLDEQAIEEMISSTAAEEDSDDVLQQLDDLEAEFAEGEESEIQIDQRKESLMSETSSVNGTAGKTGLEKKSDESLLETFRIETADNITVCTPGSLKMLTPYVLLEQEQWYENELQFIRDYLKPGMNMVDAGAGFGVYALPAAQRTGGEGRVYAFEPGSVARRHLEMSKLENGAENLEILGQALSNRSGTLPFRESDTPVLSQLDSNADDNVKAVTLDNWWAFDSEPAVDLLKVDVNGHEQQVLEGASEMLKQESPVILLATGTEGSRLKETTAWLKENSYQLFEYIPGPGLLTEFQADAPADPYLQNLVAVQADQVESLRSEGWIHNETFEPSEPEPGLWKEVISDLPWSRELMENWEQRSLSPQNRNFLTALNYLCAAERKQITEPNDRSEKAVWMLAAAQTLIELYNSGDTGLPVAFTLVRVLNALGKRGQAVEVMQKMIETTNLGQANMEADLPFLPPLPEQDQAEIKTEFKNWLTVRTVEAWIRLKDVTTLLSGPQERKLMEALEGNPEVSDSFSGTTFANKVSQKKRLSEAEGKRLASLSNSQSEDKFVEETLPNKYLNDSVKPVKRIFNRKFWTEKFTPSKAKKVVELTRKFTTRDINKAVLDQIVHETEGRLKEAGDDNVAFFIQTHALLAMNEKNDVKPELDKQLEKALKEKDWLHKSTLYHYWFDKVESRREVQAPQVTAIIISNRFKEKSVENLKRLSQQLKGRGEIIFVNNGIEDSEFDPLIEYVDTYVKANGNSGAYLARNLGAVFAKGDFLLFVDDDGIPDEGFVDAHLKVQKRNNIVAARGACYSGNKKDPDHYNLGDKIIPAPTYLEGNTSYKGKAFYKTTGWGDYILFGHGGMELGLRFTKEGIKQEQQIYTPYAKLKHSYSLSKEHLLKKRLKQGNSLQLIRTKHAIKNGVNKKNVIKNRLKQREFSTPSDVVKITVEQLQQFGLKSPIWIPKGETHRITNIFKKHEYALPSKFKFGNGISILDIGANVGIFALYASKWAQNVNLFCFEPNPQVHPLLEMNTRGISNVRIFKHAMGERAGELKLYQHPINTGQTSTTYNFKGATQVNVPVKKSGQVIKDLNIQNIDVLKIDTEGAEVSILKGMSEYLENVKVVMAEYHSEQDRKEIEMMLPGFMLYSAQIEELRGVGTVKYINVNALK